jgi:phenylpropionate dioxygenase-like ring-hydroxylating dioxygenase large terminal subunit
VLWAAAAGLWRCFEDRCPHRLATLSDGLLDKQRGEIVCAYHGWRFQVRAAALMQPLHVLPALRAPQKGALAGFKCRCQS